MERHEEMLSPEEQYAQLAPTLDTDGFSLYAAAEEITGLKVYEEFPYEDNHGMFEMADGHTLLRYLEAAYFGTVTWEIVPGTPYERAILGEVDKTTPEYRAFYQKICAGAAAHIKKRIGKEMKNVKGPITEINKESFWNLIHEAKNACGQDISGFSRLATKINFCFKSAIIICWWQTLSTAARGNAPSSRSTASSSWMKPISSRRPHSKCWV